MHANTRAGVAPRTSLGIEVLEGRTVPSAVVPRALLGRPEDAAAVRTTIDAGTQPTTTDVAIRPTPQFTWSYRSRHFTGPNRPSNVEGPRVGQSAVYLNGELVATVQRRPRFAAIGPAASGGSDTVTNETGGTTIYVNDRVIGTIYGPVHVAVVGPTVWHAPGGRPVLIGGTSYFITGSTTPPDSLTVTVAPIWVN